MSWSKRSKEARIELVKEHWCSGYSASDIARSISARLGETVTRRAILGIYHRHAAELIDYPLQGRRRASVSSTPIAIRTAIAAPQPRFVPLLDLRDRGDCKWPVQHADVIGGMLFCGCETDIKSSWCEFHAELVFGEGTKSEQEAVKMARAAA